MIEFLRQKNDTGDFIQHVSNTIFHSESTFLNAFSIPFLTLPSAFMESLRKLFFSIGLPENLNFND